MMKIIDNLPKPSPETKFKKVVFDTNNKVVDNFTVKKCPLMDNFENIDSSIWDKLNGTPVKFDTNSTTHINAQLLSTSNGTGMANSTYVLADTSNNIVKPSPSSTLPVIHGITANNDDDDSDDDDNTSKIKLYTSSKLYVGALSIVGLFILYRVVKKTI